MEILNDAENGAASAPPGPHADTLLDSYRRLADVFHHVLSEQTLDTLLERIADTLADLVPYDAFTIYQADEPRECLIPLMARDRWADEIMKDRPRFGEGITEQLLSDPPDPQRRQGDSELIG